jgi:glycosyltransferase involved in cell wall biosynthesis
MASQEAILLVGPYPPPMGGVSSHLARLAPLLIRQGFSVAVLNHYGRRPEVPYVVGALRRNPLRYFLAVRKRRSRLVHYHYSSRSSLVATALALKLSPHRVRIVTVHSPSIARDLQRRPRGLVRWGLATFDHVIAVTPQVADILSRSLPAHEISIIPAHVPSGDPQPLPPELESFLSGGPTFVAAAWRLRFTRNPSARLLLLVGERPGRSGRRYLDWIRGLLDEHGLTGRYLVMHGVDLASLFARDVTLVRPTRSDGDAVSIREALVAGTRVIASDAAVRPAGVQVVPTGDAEALAVAMEQPSSVGTRTQAEGDSSHAASLIDLYSRSLQWNGRGE